MSSPVANFLRNSGYTWEPISNGTETTYRIVAPDGVVWYTKQFIAFARERGYRESTSPEGIPSLTREIHSSVPDHQILLSFESDDAAANFYDWWNSDGFDALARWLEQQ